MNVEASLTYAFDQLKHVTLMLKLRPKANSGSTPRQKGRVRPASKQP
jgi:hypothetical protein